MGGYYKTGVACRRGHKITGDASSSFASAFCGQCGEPGVAHCDSCTKPIRGDYDNPGRISLSGWNIAAYCYACGSAYPWTAAKLDAVSELADAIEELTDHEREVIRELLPHLIEETPRTTPAGFKVAAIVGKLAGPGKAAMRKVLEEVVIEAGKRALGYS